MRSKMEDLMGAGERTGLRVNSDKTKIIKVMSTQVGGIRIGQDLLEEVESFQYLGSITAEQVARMKISLLAYQRLARCLQC